MDFPKTAQLVLVTLLLLLCLICLLLSIYALWVRPKPFLIRSMRPTIWYLALGNAIVLMVYTVKWLKAGQFAFPGEFEDIKG